MTQCPQQIRGMKRRSDGGGRRKLLDVNFKEKKKKHVDFGSWFKEPTIK